MSEQEAYRIPQIKPKLTEETAKITEDFLIPFQTVIESRRKIQETEEELRKILANLTTTIETLAEFKKENLELEKTVLNKINKELTK